MKIELDDKALEASLREYLREALIGQMNFHVDPRPRTQEEFWVRNQVSLDNLVEMRVAINERVFKFRDAAIERQVDLLVEQYLGKIPETVHGGIAEDYYEIREAPCSYTLPSPVCDNVDQKTRIKCSYPFKTE